MGSVHNFGHTYWEHSRFNCTAFQPPYLSHNPSHKSDIYIYLARASSFPVDSSADTALSPILSQLFLHCLMLHLWRQSCGCRTVNRRLSIGDVCPWLHNQCRFLGTNYTPCKLIFRRIALFV